MIPEHRDQMEHFLADQHEAITTLILQAYRQAGGHYSAMTPAQRQAQAESDSGEFIEGLLRGMPDAAAIEQMAQEMPDSDIVADIMRMTTALEKLFNGFVETCLVTRPALARDLTHRATFVIDRFRLRMSAANLNNVVNGRNIDLLLDKPPARR